MFTQVDAGQLGGARIVMAACGWYHKMVVSAEVRVWTFGYGGNGRLGLNDEQSRLVPTLLAAELFEGSKIVTVAAGCYHTMAVGENGALWTWNARSSSQLGLRHQQPAGDACGGGGGVWGFPGAHGCLRRRPQAGGDGDGQAVGVGLRSARSTGPQRRGKAGWCRRAGAGSAAAGGGGGRRRSRRAQGSSTVLCFAPRERASPERARAREEGREGGREGERERESESERARERASERERERARASERERTTGSIDDYSVLLQA
jgi:hypothetical protein